MLFGISAQLRADSVTVTDITDWGATPMETVNTDIPYLGYPNGVEVYAGINTLSVNNGVSTTTYSGFCVDPFHWSTSAPMTYSEVPLADAPKSPATLNAATALQIEELWADYFSPTMSCSAAAGLQIAIWDLVSSNAVANDGLLPSEAFSLNQGNDYGAAADIASLANFQGAPADLTGLTGNAQDYVIEMNNNLPPVPTPDGGQTLMMLALTVGALVIARPALIRSANSLRLASANPVRSKNTHKKPHQV